MQIRHVEHAQNNARAASTRALDHSHSATASRATLLLLPFLDQSPDSPEEYNNLSR